MSEKILKALMQLFAIIARPEQDGSDRRNIVEAFLQQQLNKDLVQEYLKIFDNYYEIYQKKSIRSKREKNISLSSVKVLKICTEINQELTQKQRLIVLFRLYEFVKIGGQVTAQELIFVSTVADVFNIEQDEYLLIKDFVLYSFAEIPESERVLIIDNSKKCTIPRVKHLFSESLHGQIHILSLLQANMYIVRYKGENELSLNGQLIVQRKIYVLTPGSSLRGPKIKPVYYSDIVSTFNIYKTEKNIVFSVKDLEYEFKGGKKGLQKMNFSEESGQLISIMGASGTGKSTLLNVLNGTNKPSAGEVSINRINIHNEKDKIEGLIGFVSQDDLLIEELTVFQNLYYNAKLCFDNYSHFQILHSVLKVLQNLGLYEVKDMVVGTPLDKRISGGQRKRLNIALELIREPAVLFLDEPTSGLSSRDSVNIMDLLKELSLKGKLVFVVIHQPSSELFKMFDKLLIIDEGGYLIYKGNPIDSIVYFKTKANLANWNDSECPVCGNVNPDQIFNIIESRILDEYGNVTQTRKILPKEWNSFLDVEHEEETQTEIPFKKEIPDNPFKIPNKLRQFKVFITRDVISKLTNKQYLIINIFETPVLAFLLSYIVKYYSIDATNVLGYTLYDNSNLPIYIFMAVIIAIFIGLTVSAEEIIKDRKILKREKFLNLSWSSYLFSKVVILLILSAIQSLIFVLVGNSIMEIKGMFFQYWIVLFSSWSCANLIGLNISDSFKTVITIYILIPFLVIPQLIL
ncbi:MAG: ATP-binding cassette domain-containing protein, partial [Bacteroidales bacterium]|nr:ATP-binding cassette domain-containing protein [Bacteroidales bacterium]